LAFSAGARSCIGIRFAMAESISILANIVHAFEILLPPLVELKVKEMERSGVGELERYEWVTAWTPGVTNTPLRAHVRVRRRT
jgi:cytochrome P450